MAQVLQIVEQRPWSDFAPEVMFIAGEAPPDLIDNYIREAAIAFARRSQVLIRDVSIDLQACVKEYPIRTADNERIESMQSMGRAPKARDCVFGDRCSLCLPCGSDAEFCLPDRIVVNPAPKRDQHDAIWVRVAVVPTQDSCEADAILYERYHETIVNGALSRVLLLRGTPWYDPALATFHRTMFDREITAAGMDRLTHGRRGPFKMIPRRVV